MAASWAISIAYEIWLGRALPPGPYATFQTASSVLMVIGLTSTVVQAAAAYEVARQRSLSAAWLRICAALTAVLAGGCAALSGPLGGVWHLSPPVVWLVGGVAASWVWLAAVRGIAQGMERYVVLGTSYVAENALRLLGTALFVSGLGVVGGLLAIGLGAVCALFLTGAIVPRRLAPGPPLGAADAGRIAVGSALATWTAVLPLLVLRPIWPAGPYAALTAMNLFAKALAQVAAWFGLTLYPRLVADPGGAARHFRFSLVAAALGTGAVAAGGAAFVPLLLRIVFAGRYAADTEVFRWFFLAAVPVSLFGLFVTRAMARQDGGELLLLSVGAAAWAGLFAVWHTGFTAMLVDLAAIGGLLVAALVRQRVQERAGGAAAT